MLETNFYGTIIEIEDEDMPQVGSPPTILPEPSPPGQGPPSWRHITPEQQELSREVLRISGNNGWWLGTGEKDQSAPRRRLYAMNDARRCERCNHGDSAIPWIETHLHTAGRICLNCHLDEVLGSLLHLELNRLPKNSIESDFIVGNGKFLADDPRIDDLPLWEPGTLTHFGAVMSSGKTTFVINRAEADPDAIYLLLSPRKSLTYNVWSHRRRHWGSSSAWGLFYGGSDQQYRQIGKCGAMGPPPSLPSMVQAIRRTFGEEIPPVYLFVDELDFCSELMLANILRRASPEIKDLLCQIVEKHGIVTAGQTEFTATLELFAAELGIDPDENLWGYYNTAQPTGQVAELREYPDGKGKKNQLIAGVVEAVADGLKQGKPQYVHADGRRTAQIIGSFLEDSQLFDKYHRGIERNRDLLWRGRIDDAMMPLVTSNALDVGVSIRDPDAVTHVVMSENPLHYGSPPSYPQRGLRNRDVPPLFFHYIPFNNPLPMSPSEAVERAEEPRVNETR